MSELKTWRDLSPYEKFKDILGFIGPVFFFIGIIISLNTISKISTKNYDNSLIGRCMDGYGKISNDLRKYEKGDTTGLDVKKLMYDYFDLTNEELFYIKNEVVSPEVGYDWLNGMVKKLRSFEKEPFYQNIKKEYPRIEKTFDMDLNKSELTKSDIEGCVSRLKEYNSNK